MSLADIFRTLLKQNEEKLKQKTCVCSHPLPGCKIKTVGEENSES